MKNSSQKKLEAAARAVAAVTPNQHGVLVVEDDPDLQWSLARMLTVHGNRVVGTSSGEGALALVSQWPVDLVLVDEDLPGMSGIEVATRLRATHPAIPVVLMTGKATPEFRVAAKLAGAVACLAKPFRSETLSEVLSRLLVNHETLSPAE